MKEVPHRPMLRLKVVILAVSVVILSLAGAVAYTWFSEHPIYPSYDPKHPTAAQRKAINDAIEWRENRVLGCLTVITPAVHPETGARYTFSDSCTAPGWIGEN